MRNKKTLTEKVCDDIYEDIVNQRLKCGSKITLDDLSGMYGVSYSPIREALGRLKEMGLVNYYSNKGVFVVDFTSEDIQDLYRFLSDMDALAVKYCKNIPNDTMLIYEITEIIEKCNKLIKEGNVAEWKTYSQNFHKVFYEYAKSNYLKDTYNRLKPKVELISLLYYKKVEIVDSINNEHVDIFNSIMKNDFDEAADKMRKHLLSDTIKATRAFAEYKENVQK